MPTEPIKDGARQTPEKLSIEAGALYSGVMKMDRVFTYTFGDLAYRALRARGQQNNRTTQNDHHRSKRFAPHSSSRYFQIRA
jgi:UDP-galactopyranose mutase